MVEFIDTSLDTAEFTFTFIGSFKTFPPRTLYIVENCNGNNIRINPEIGMIVIKKKMKYLFKVIKYPMNVSQARANSTLQIIKNVLTFCGHEEAYLTALLILDKSINKKNPAILNLRNISCVT